MKRVSYLLPAAIALFVLGGCVINEKKPADSAPPPPPPATAAPTASAAPADAGATTDAAPAPATTSTASGTGTVLKKPPSRDAGVAK
jgi:hypothetical protein